MAKSEFIPVVLTHRLVRPAKLIGVRAVDMSSIKRLATTNGIEPAGA
jgi:hypothetical protein